jgi:hypothetical protein
MNKLRTLVSSAVLIFTFAFGVSLAYGQITPSADSYTNTAAPTTNYGANTLLDVDGATQATYIQFNLASIPATYTSADITKATLKLYVNSVATAGSFNVDYVNGTWAENTITHNLAPALGTTVAASVPITTVEKNQFILIDVTAAVQAWLSGTPNDGIALVANGTFNATFDSKENGSTSHAPELDIVFGGTLSGVTTASGSGLTGGGTSGTLNLGLLTTCANGQVLEWNGTAWVCTTPKGTGTITGVTTASSSGLTGGGTSGTLNLKVNTAEIPLLGGTNTFTGNQTVNGIFAASSSAFGVTGTATSTTGLGIGVAGTAATPSGYGVEGINNATSGGVGVYGSTGAAAGYGVEGINTSGNGTGVFGTAGHFGVQGIATATSGSTVGVFGSGVDGLQGSGTLHGVYAAGTGAGSIGVYGTSPGYGLYGVATNTTGTSFGVYGSGGSNGVYGVAQNFGLYGVATATSGNSVGVYGNGVDGLQGSGSTYGVYAAGTGASATGVYATTGSATGYGVEGVNTSSNGTGVYGTAAHFGVWGVGGSNGVYGTGTNWGVYGTATNTSGTAVGVYGDGVDGLQGNGSAYGVYAATPAGIAGTYGVYGAPSVTGATALGSPGGAVWADTNLANGGPSNTFALLATADNNLAGVFFNNSGQSPTIDVNNLGSGGTGNVVRAEGTGGSCTLTGGGDTACTGVLKSVVATTSSAGARHVETYSMQSPENWFEDFGSGALSNGAATITLDRTFTQTVNTGTEYHVFLTPNGDSKGLYVSQKAATSFEVREQGGGVSSVAFDYRIVAKRVGYEKVRLADVTERFNQEEARSKNMRRPARSSAEARSGAQITTPPPAHPVVEQQLAPKMLVLPVLPSAAPRQAPVTPTPAPIPPTRAALPLMAAQPK